MPHQCTSCTETFPDGSKKMLSGCPRCGGNTFQYLPEGQVDDPPEESPPERPDAPGIDSPVTETVGRAATTVREYVSRSRSDPPTSDSPAKPADTDGGEADDEIRTPTPTQDTPPSRDSKGEADPDTERRTDQASSGEPTPGDDAAMVSDDAPSGEDTAQASARGELADLSDLPDDTAEPETDAPPRPDGRVVKKPDQPDRPDLETLREELNDQFESIKILEPGQYELNLMGLYDREEHIIALQEDGKYVIEVPEKWRSERTAEPED